MKALYMVASSNRAPRWRVGLVFALANSREKHASATSKIASEGVRLAAPYRWSFAPPDKKLAIGRAEGQATLDVLKDPR